MALQRLRALLIAFGFYRLLGMARNHKSLDQIFVDGTLMASMEPFWLPAHRGRSDDHNKPNSDPLEHESDSPMNTAEIILSSNRTRQAMVSADGKVFAHFLSHIPKSGGTFAYKAINQMFWPSPQRHQLAAEERFRPCDMGVNPLSKFETNYFKAYHNVTCSLWMAEDSYTDQAAAVYTIVRDPKQITLSQYFHCTESKVHQLKSRRMPPLGRWLRSWVDAIGNETKIENNARYLCYNPINMQSRYTKFDPQKGKEDLKKRFDVIGDTAQMVKSICAIFIRYTGWVPSECDCTNPLTAGELQSTAAEKPRQRRRLLQVSNTRVQINGQPKRLTVHSAANVFPNAQREKLNRPRRRQFSLLSDTQDPINDPTKMIAAGLPPDQGKNRPKQRRKNRRRRKKHQPVQDYNPETDSHGVQNHGATFETNRRQDALIAKLTETDAILYQMVKEVFAEQLQEIEDEYSIRVCSEFRKPQAEVPRGRQRRRRNMAKRNPNTPA